MIRLSDIPLFTGDGSQDADKWQQDFLSSTGHYGDEAVARLFISKLAIGSPAHTLVDSLPDPIKTSWFKLERVFRTEWLPSRRVEAPKQDPWEAFEKHVLTEEMIFGGSKNGDSTSSPSGVIVAWVDEHLRLGRNTGGTDDCLVRMTKLLLPVFIRTVISLKPKPETFTDICALIRQTPHDVLEMERTRYYETSRREERLSAMERKLEEITQRIDGLSNSANASSKATFSSHSVTNHVGEVPPSSPFVVPPQPVPPPPLQATVTPKTSSIINAPESQPSPVEVEATQSILPSRMPLISDLWLCDYTNGFPNRTSPEKRQENCTNYINPIPHRCPYSHPGQHQQRSNRER
ncbi:hypothetical protein FRC03_000842 [Tulasnella sp. 419]|nr:hypothetical protein FRC03_000842 [Tulasnella sp. 419]